MNRKYRLKSSADFRRVRRTGKSYAHPLAILIVAPNEYGVSRCGIVASKALGSAVVRNRAKRRMRAVIQSLLPAISSGWDMILIARPASLEAEWSELRKGMNDLLRRANVMTVEK
jgi:ribonuclease P protein component